MVVPAGRGTGGKVEIMTLSQGLQASGKAQVKNLYSVWYMCMGCIVLWCSGCRLRSGVGVCESVWGQHRYSVMVHCTLTL